jgi:hypothetical protein
VIIETDYKEDNRRDPNAPPAIETPGLVSYNDTPVALHAGLTLEVGVQNAAWLDAMGLPVQEIEFSLGRPAGYVIGLRALPDYREFIRRCLQVKARAIVNGTTDIGEMFDGQIAPSAATLIEVRDNPFSKGGDRIKAATEFLNRAPAAPKSSKEVNENRTVIVLPVSELQNMQRALIEEGTVEDIETVNLLEGVDYSVGDDDTDIGDIGEKVADETEGEITVEHIT